ncbi:MAG: acyl carrier protein, partial [Caldilineae bacterium]
MQAVQTLSRDELRQTVLDVLETIAPEADFDALDPNADMREALEIDSFDFLNLVIGLNEALGVEIPEKD